MRSLLNMQLYFFFKIPSHGRPSNKINEDNVQKMEHDDNDR